MRHTWQEQEDTRKVSYEWQYKNQWQSFAVTADKEASQMELGSETEFITEHYWGYTKINDHKTFEYEVKHPTWEHYKVRDYQIDVDFGLVYGQGFKELGKSIRPKSVMLAEGSLITVENKRTL